jgi:hypothetical protein
VFLYLCSCFWFSDEEAEVVAEADPETETEITKEEMTVVTGTGTGTEETTAGIPVEMTGATTDAMIDEEMTDGMIAETTVVIAEETTALGMIVENVRGTDTKTNDLLSHGKPEFHLLMLTEVQREDIRPLRDIRPRAMSAAGQNINLLPQKPGNIPKTQINNHNFLFIAANLLFFMLCGTG